MTKVDPQLLGTGGTYFVMAQLAFRGFHASCTFGNAPNVDILVSTPDGGSSVAVQVKTAYSAMHHRGRGTERKPDHLQWALGRRAAKIDHRGMFFAFVDARDLDPSKPPDVYVVPSLIISEFCKDWVDEVKLVRLHIGIEKIAPFKNNWDCICEALTGGR